MCALTLHYLLSVFVHLLILVWLQMQVDCSASKNLPFAPTAAPTAAPTGAAASTDYEYSGSFSLSAETYTWRAQKTGCPQSSATYADATMKFVILPLQNSNLAALNSTGANATSLLSGTTTTLNAGSWFSSNLCIALHRSTCFLSRCVGCRGIWLLARKNVCAGVFSLRA